MDDKLYTVNPNQILKRTREIFPEEGILEF